MYSGSVLRWVGWSSVLLEVVVVEFPTTTTTSSSKNFGALYRMEKITIGRI